MLDKFGISPEYQTQVLVAALVLPVLTYILWTWLVPSGTTFGGPPPVWTGGLPLIGHFHKFSDNPVATVREGYEALGNVFTMRFLNFNLTFLLGPEAHAPFFDARDQQLSQSEPYKFMTPIFGKGIVFDAPLDKKNEQLRFITHSLNSHALKAHIDAIVLETVQFFDQWGDEGEVDLLEEMAKLTIFTASRCLLGKEVREQLFDKVADMLHRIDEGISPIAIFFPNIPLPSFKRRDEARAEFATVLSEVIRKRRESKQHYEDLLQGFMEAEYTTGEKLTDDAITGMLLGTLFAGQHTSSITTAWTVLHLLNEKDQFNRAMKEQLEALGEERFAAPIHKSPAGSDVGGPSGAGLCFDTVSNSMDFLHNSMKEALRISPPLILLMRMVYSPLSVCKGKYVVPKGHYVFASPAVSMNLPHGPDNVFTNPEKFDPDRYTKPREEDKLVPHAYTAFGGGRHACMGERFGYLQVKTIISILLRTFDLEMVDPMPVPNYRAMVVGPTQPCRVRYRRRKTPYVPM